MTPAQKKAKELIEKFEAIFYVEEIEGFIFNKSKQCALIHVNGIIEILSDWSGYYYGIEEQLYFFMDVRDEITNL